ncbi:MAG: GNAT family N-acetyltransferase [Leptolyngbya sp. SIO1D8]|nr:GNAT family N-acetyltransferase [Leptolyngbya sp. SIO1D8]
MQKNSSPWDIRKAQSDDFGEIAKLIAAQTQKPQTHCLQSDVGEGAAEIHQEMSHLALNNEFCGVLALHNQQCVGAFGCELDEELGRGWLRGPFALADSHDWNLMATALYQELLTVLPASIRQTDSFLNIANQRGQDFYRDQGFRQEKIVHVYVANSSAIPFSPSPHCGRLNTEQAPALMSLHDSIFPNVYASGQSIVSEIDDDHQVFVYTQGDEVVGYLHGTIDSDLQEAMVEFVGVKATSRGQGIGFQLLQAALHWFFTERKMPEVSLNVDDDLANARSLYEKVGFRLKYTGINHRKTW